MEMSPASPNVAYYLAGEPVPVEVGGTTPDTFRRELITREEAVAALAAAGAVEVAHIQGIPDSKSVTIFGGVPTLRNEGGPPEDWVYIPSTGMDFDMLSFATSYDEGGFDTEHGVGGGVSQFLFEITGGHAYDIAVRKTFDSTLGPIELQATSGSDGGQYIGLNSNDGAYIPLLVSEIKLWRVSGDFGPVDPPGPPFWTSFVNAREIV